MFWQGLQKSVQNWAFGQDKKQLPLHENISLIIMVLPVCAKCFALKDVHGSADSTIAIGEEIISNFLIPANMRKFAFQYMKLGLIITILHTLFQITVSNEINP